MTASIATVSRGAHVVFLVPLLSLLLAGCGFNDIPTYEEQAKAKWAEVLNQYQRRSDLIPNLVETVKGFAKQVRWSPSVGQFGGHVKLGSGCC